MSILGMPGRPVGSWTLSTEIFDRQSIASVTVADAISGFKTAKWTGAGIALAPGAASDDLDGARESAS